MSGKCTKSLLYLFGLIWPRKQNHSTCFRKMSLVQALVLIRGRAVEAAPRRCKRLSRTSPAQYSRASREAGAHGNVLQTITRTLIIAKQELTLSSKMFPTLAGRSVVFFTSACEFFSFASSDSELGGASRTRRPP